MTLSELCKELNNWDFNTRAVKYFDRFEIKDNKLIAPEKIDDYRYFRICGSLFNDGVHQNAECLTDEVFSGAVWLMAVPPEILKLLDEINEWEQANAEQINSPFTSESYGNYSYTKDANNSTWQKAFATRLNRWRKI